MCKKKIDHAKVEVIEVKVGTIYAESDYFFGVYRKSYLLKFVELY